MVDATIIQINISGPVQSGKTVILQEIKKLLESYNYCVAVPDRAERFNPGKTIEKARNHEKPKPDKTVIVLTESCRWYAGRLDT